MTRKTTQTNRQQSEKFKRLAREHGADDNEAAFEEKLKKLAKAKPKPEPIAKPQRKKSEKRR